MKLAIASDHGAFELKQAVVAFLREKGFQIEDLGTANSDSVDYPDFAAAVASRVSAGQTDLGILACGTGIGMSIAANKFKNVRAALVSDEYTARMAKEHNNANILCLGGRVRKPDEAKRLVQLWLESKYEGGRHQKRLDKIAALEKKNLR